MNAFIYRMPAGIPGNVGRIQASTIEAMVINNLLPPTRFGDPVTLATAGNGGVRPIASAADVAGLMGFLVRPYPSHGSPLWPSDPLRDPVDSTTQLPTAGAPPVSGICNILRRGYISVAVAGPAQAVKNGQVYVVTSAGTPAIPVGAIVAAAGANATAIPGAHFQGPQDASGNCEISVFVGPTAT